VDSRIQFEGWRKEDEGGCTEQLKMKSDLWPVLHW